jgi:subtilisin family serine protease
MKYRILFCFLSISAMLYPQTALTKITQELNTSVAQVSDNDAVHVWVFFKDKGTSLSKAAAQPEAYLSSKCIERRKLRGAGSVIKESDLPVNQSYIQKVEALGATVNQISKWFNGISISVPKKALIDIASLQEVGSLDVVYKLKAGKPVTETLEKQSVVEPVKQPAGVYSLDYGYSYTQLNQIKVPAVHALGYTGKGIIVAVFDAGFSRLTHQAFSSMTILNKRDFVNGGTNVGDATGLAGTGEHGTETLSAVGAYYPGKLVGPAYEASFILAKTENTDSETPVEEDNWIAAAEWVDSLGADVISSSLGYDEFDSPYTSYTYLNMDGKTCRITLGALQAARNGIVVCNSASNNGYDANHNTLSAPADADTIISAGSVTSTGARSSFSSVGNTIDGRVKPDVMAMGSSDALADPSTDTGVTYQSGTSFSCPLTAGVAALLLQAKPSLTPVAVRDALRTTASNASTPDRLMGWGIINALSAVTLVTDSSYQPPIVVDNFTVYDAYPNPFNPSTTIKYALPKEGTVKAMVYDINGSLVKTLLSGVQSGGVHSDLIWNGYNDNGSIVASGMYLVRISFDNSVITKKVLFLK